MKRPFLIALPVVAIAAAVLAGALWRIGDGRAASSALTVAAATANTAASAAAAEDFGGPFALTDQNGKLRTDKDFRGKYMLIFFGYTYCPDVCPTALAVASQALDMIGDRSKAIAPIFITVDPKRDTPEKLKAYLSAFDATPPSTRPGFVGLTGSPEDIAKVAQGYNVFYQAHLDGFRVDGVGYSIDHTSETYLMSPEGKFVSYYKLGITPDEMATDLARKVPG